MYDQQSLQQPQLSGINHSAQQPIAQQPQFGQQQPQYASQQAQQPQYAGQQVQQQPQLSQQAQQQPQLSQQQPQFASAQQPIPAANVQQPNPVAQQPASASQQLAPQPTPQVNPVQQPSPTQTLASGYEQVPSAVQQSPQSQQIPVGSAQNGLAEQIPVQFGQQTSWTPNQSQPTRQEVEMVDTQTIADVLARRVGLTTQQLAQAVPRLRPVLADQQPAPMQQWSSTEQSAPTQQPPSR